jgi:Tfp pilus assembly protein PilX
VRLFPRPDDRGIVLVVAYLFTAILIAWTFFGFQRSATELRASQRWIDTLQSFHLTEGGVDDALVWLRTRPSPPAGTLRFNPFGGPRGLGGGQYTAEIDPDDNNPVAFIDYYMIDATGVNGPVQASRRVLHLVRNESFSRYSYFTNWERMASGARIWFTTRDRLAGPVHTNDQLNIAGNPIFDGPVSTVAPSLNYYNGGPPLDNPVFNGGLTRNAPSVTLPLTVTPLRTAAAGPGGLWLDGNTTIALQADGTMLVTNPVRGWVNMPQPIPANGAVFVNGGNLTVSGTLRGQVTLGTSNNVIVANSVQYATDPRSNPASTDVLGLVAEQNVVVSQSAPFDVAIHGSVMALSESFTVERWWVGPPKGTLSVLGGIIQTRRGPVGTFSGATGAKLSGYSKDYQYDTRLSNMAPPFYPTTTRYQAVMWQEENP